MSNLFLIGGPGTETLDEGLVGGKAANLARMASLGLPVPPAFVIPTTLCEKVNRGKASALDQLDEALAEGIAFLEETTGRRFGDRRRPLIVSVRSGAARSMPGMLDTVLDVGTTGEAMQGLVRLTGNPRFAADCRRRFLQGYATTVLGLDRTAFEARLAALTTAEGGTADRDLDGEALRMFADACLADVAARRLDIPDAAMAQLKAAARAVFASWDSERARTYRRLQHLETLRGTAVTVQAMVFGNAGQDSGAGVAFSRDPSTGLAAPVVEMLFEAQGEDVVSGARTPEGGEALAERLPEASRALLDALALLERTFRDVQDVEFTVADGELWLLQTRAAKRTPRAALRFAVDYVRAGLITPEEALHRLEGLRSDDMRATRFTGTPEPIAQGVPAAPGVATGRIALDSHSAERMAATDPVILIRPDTSTADVAGFHAAAGILTAAGGRTAHAALVARQMGKPCVVGCGTLAVDEAARHARLGDNALSEGEWLSVDGETGCIYPGRLGIVSDAPDAELAEWAAWQRRAAIVPA